MIGSTTLPATKPILIVGEIDYEAYSDFSAALLRREAASQIATVELFSEGGDPYASLAFAARIRNSPLEITIIGNGLVASAAVLILAAGDKRIMTKESWLMVHEESGAPEGPVHDMEVVIHHFRKMEYQCNEMLAAVTKLTQEQWAVHHKATTYFTAQECLEIGIIDEVI